MGRIRVRTTSMVRGLFEDMVDVELGYVRVDGHRWRHPLEAGQYEAVQLYHQTWMRHGEVFFLHGSIERVLRGIMRRAGPEEVLNRRAM